ncbi:MAG: hypothetical protein LUE20_03680 [Oscillospiraceae bacterium]|nr:hypothetical protein [Oscillospiraceae bacterium]
MAELKADEVFKEPEQTELTATESEATETEPDTKLSAHSARMTEVSEHSTVGATLKTASEMRHNRNKKQVQEYNRKALKDKESEVPETNTEAETEAEILGDGEKVQEETAEIPIKRDFSELDKGLESHMRSTLKEAVEAQPDLETDILESPSRLSESIIPEDIDLTDYADEITWKSKRERTNREQKDKQGKKKSSVSSSEQRGEAKKKPGRLSFDDEQDGMVHGAGMGIGRRVVSGATSVAAGYIHTKLNEAEQDNSAIEGVHQAELLTENSVHKVSGKSKSRKSESKSKRELKQETKTESKSGRLKFSAEEGGGKETTGPVSVKSSKDTAEKKKATRHVWQKKQYKEAYTAAKQGKTVSGDAAKATAKVADKAKEVLQSVIKNSKGILIGLGAIMLLIVIVAAMFTSCTAIFQGIQNSFISTTYSSDDDDIYAVENAYVSLETALYTQICNTVANYPGYDEYSYEIDNIYHDPYQLISYLTVKYGEFTYSDVASELQTLFLQQYTLTIVEEAEIRTRTETQIGSMLVTDPYTGQLTVIYYEYEAEVEYVYRTLKVTLVNNGFDETVRNRMTTDEASLYDLYNATYGNRSDLFGET